MTEEKRKMHTIRGTRHSIMLSKTVKGMPGFAPESYEREVGEVVFNFPHDETCVYFQQHKAAPILEKQDMEKILEVMKRRFNKAEWETVEPSV
jgi:2',3'-cyclic-nucleotide 2'-phosphodiesterase (5'-nucleotidase family)